MRQGVQRHTPTASPPGKGPIPIVQESGWASVPVWTGAENLEPTGIQVADSPVSRELSYRLRYSSEITTTKQKHYSS